MSVRSRSQLSYILTISHIIAADVDRQQARLRYPIGSLSVVSRHSGINFEKYGAAALMMRLPYLRTALKEALKTDGRIGDLCAAYGEAVLLRDRLRRKRFCDAQLLDRIEVRCLELEANVAFHLVEAPRMNPGFEILG